MDVSGTQVRALAYPALTGAPEPGDRVLLNTNALDLGLGTPQRRRAGRPMLAAGETATAVIERFARLSASYGTKVELVISRWAMRKAKLFLVGGCVGMTPPRPTPAWM